MNPTIDQRQPSAARAGCGEGRGALEERTDGGAPTPLAVRFVLMRPRNPENLGAAARALCNFGFADWAIVDPRTLDFTAARRVAVHAEALLDRPRLTASLDEAVAGCAFVTGTSSRHVRGRQRLTPEEWAAEVVRLSPGARVALVFGDERSGLSNAEIERCHALSSIPTLPAQPSLNLAQAILLYAYEAHRAALAQGCDASGAPPLSPRPPPPPTPPTAWATDEALQRLEGLLREALTASEFLDQGGERGAVRDLMSPLLRARLTRRESRLAEAALHHLLRAMARQER